MDGRPTTARRWTLVRSAAVGVVASATDLAALCLLVQALGLAPALANVPALAAGLAVQFLGNKWFAFRDRLRALARQGAQFALVEAGALAFNALGFHLFVTLTPVPYPAARVVTQALVYFGWSFPLWGLVFRTPQPQEGA